MTTRLLLLLAASLFLLTGTACRGPKKPKESTTPAADLDNQFREKWVGKRVLELGAAGKAAEDARVQAEAEYAQRYRYALPQRK